ncbi:hypothetical protein, partial [Salmonella enterica]
INTHLDFQHHATVYDAAHPRAKRGKKCDFTGLWGVLPRSP